MGDKQLHVESRGLEFSGYLFKDQQAEQWRRENETAFPAGNDCPVTCILWLLPPVAATSALPVAEPHALPDNRGLWRCGGSLIRIRGDCGRSADPAVSMARITTTVLA